MPKVEEFSRKMVERTLDDMNVRYLRDKDGDFVALFGEDEKAGCEIRLHVIITGSRNQILRAAMLSDADVRSVDAGLLYRVCNTWNREHRWPRAYVDGDGDIVLEEYVDLDKGIHQELLRDFMLTVMATGFQFWRWAHNEQGLF